MKTKTLKIGLGVFVHLVTIAVVCFALGIWWLAHEYSKPGPLASELFFTVEKGQGVSQIAENLQTQGAVAYGPVFKITARLMDTDATLKAGEYQLSPGLSIKQIMTKMRTGDVFERKVTVPEGLTSFEIVEILKKVSDLRGEIDFVPKEGSLLPNTYVYTHSETRMDIIEEMQDGMTQAIDELWPDRAENLPFSTKEQAITLASIVEKETAVESERKRVAGVFINRLRTNIALQTDPTVIYALTKGKPKNEGKGPLGRRLLVSDLSVDSPYNTYKNAGLPPGPIANPGRASIEAVLHPEEHNFIYFVADGTGGHVFAATLDEHNSNVKKWRKIRKEKGN